MEQVCGRPLGLKFKEVTCELFIVDACFVLMVVRRNSGVAKHLEISAEGVLFQFTNALDIYQDTGIIYFIDTSILLQRLYA